MNNDCACFAAGDPLHTIHTLEDWLGPTQAIVRCEKCSRPAIIYLASWKGAQLADRSFALLYLAPEVLGTYLNNINRDYCDLTRKQAETESLFNQAGPDQFLISLHLPDLTILTSEKTPLSLKPRRWQDIPPDENNPPISRS